MAKAITNTLTAVPTSGTLIVTTGIPRFLPVVLLLHPGRTGACRLQWAAGALTEPGEFIPVTAAAGGDDSLMLRFDTLDKMPTHIAAAAGTINVSYTVMVDTEIVRR